MLEQLKKGLDATLATVCVVLMVVLVFCVSWQVISRYFLEVSSTWTDEIARFLMIWTCLLGAAYTVGVRKHIAIDLLPLSLGPRNKAILDLFINACILVFSVGVICFGGWFLLSKVYVSGQLTTALKMPMWLVYVVIPLSGAIMAFYSMYFIVRNWVGLMRGAFSNTQEVDQLS